MAQKPIPIRLAQTLGITISSFLAGTLVSISIIQVPTMLKAPSTILLRQWATCYNIGKDIGRPLGTLSALCYFYVAYKLPAHAGKTKLYAYILAGLLSVGIVPYTFAVMVPTNNKLLSRVEKTKALALSETDELVASGVGDETAHELVDWWGVLNLGRGLLVTVAAGVGTWTALE